MTSSDRLEGIRFNRKFLVVKQACRKDTPAVNDPRHEGPDLLAPVALPAD